jgi:hypothetical protein
MEPNRKIEAPAAKLTPEEEEAELLAAGWKRIRATQWQAPSGGQYRGPHAAWTVMWMMTKKTKAEGMP